MKRRFEITMPNGVRIVTKNKNTAMNLLFKDAIVEAVQQASGILHAIEWTENVTGNSYTFEVRHG